MSDTIDDLLRAAAPVAVRVLLDVASGAVKASERERRRAAKALIERIPDADLHRLIAAQRPGAVGALLAHLEVPAELHDLARQLHAEGVEPCDVMAEGRVMAVLGREPHLMDQSDGALAAACIVLAVRVLLADMKGRGQ